MNFEEKVESMKIHEIVDAMIQGVKKQHVKLDFSTYGDVVNGVCYGCGATNAICEIIGTKFDANSLPYRETRVDFLETSYEYLITFETAINWLRHGDPKTFISGLGDIKSSMPDVSEYRNTLLPLFNSSIVDGTLDKKLKEYEDFRDWLKVRNL